MNNKRVIPIRKAEDNLEVKMLLLDRHKSFPAIMKPFFALGGPEGAQIADIRDFFGYSSVAHKVKLSVL